MSEKILDMQEKKYRRAGEYPCGIADFPDLRNRGCVYVDKTDLIYEMAQTKYVLGFPNAEVRGVLMKNILPIVNGTDASDNSSYAVIIRNALAKGDYDRAKMTLQHSY